MISKSPIVQTSTKYCNLLVFPELSLDGELQPRDNPISTYPLTDGDPSTCSDMSQVMLTMLWIRFPVASLDDVTSHPAVDVYVTVDNITCDQIESSLSVWSPIDITDDPNLCPSKYRFLVRKARRCPLVTEVSSSTAAGCQFSCDCSDPPCTHVLLSIGQADCNLLPPVQLCEVHTEPRSKNEPNEPNEPNGQNEPNEPNGQNGQNEPNDKVQDNNKKDKTTD